MRAFQYGGYDYGRNELILVCVAGDKGAPGYDITISYT
jgi:hypothetical protein